MQVTIQPSALSGLIQAPASKSSMQRACAASLIAGGETLIKNPGHSSDDKAALAVIEALGAQIRHQDEGPIRIISGGISPVGSEINCGESGLGIRMFAPIVALSSTPITINGRGSLLKRPMDFFDNVLPELGIEIHSNKGRLPLHIKGPLQPANISIDGSLSSQFLTGLLMAYAAAGADQVSIKVRELRSKPYIDLTLKVMADFGLMVPENRNYEEFYFSGPSHFKKPAHRIRTYAVEGDWSGAAFLLVAGAIAGDITVRGLDVQSTQADKSIIKALSDAQAIMEIHHEEIHIRQSPLKSFRFDATDCPDLFPPLAALAVYCDGTSEISGIERLVYKESNRAMTIMDELKKRKISVELIGNMMRIKGAKGFSGAAADSHNDHRIAMMNAVIALKSLSSTILSNAEAVKKSYPDFFGDLKKLNATIQAPESSFADAFDE